MSFLFCNDTITFSRSDISKENMFFHIDNEDKSDSALPPALYQANVAGDITHESLTNTAYQSPTQS